MSGKFVRQSYYRHVVGKGQKKQEDITGIAPLCTGDGNYLAVNSKFVAYATSGGGGPVAVHSLTHQGRVPTKFPRIFVHSSKVLDFDWNPFVDTVLASASDDCNVCVTAIPEKGLESDIKEAAAVLEAHEKKVIFTQWNPCASNILASSSSDKTVRVWDVTKQAEAQCVETGVIPQSMEWNSDGSLLAVTHRDHGIEIIDPRESKQSSSIQAFTGSKASKVTWCSNLGRIAATGFAKSSARQIGIWDLKKTDKPLKMHDIDRSAGVLIPHFDPYNSILYLAGKGDSSIKYFEFVENDPFLHFISEFQGSDPQKGIAWAPKYVCDTSGPEIARAYRLTKNSVGKVSFVVPRKSPHFATELYPDSYAGVAALKGDEWLSGKTAGPVLYTLNPKKAGDNPRGSSGGAFKVGKKVTVQSLQSELAASQKKVTDLEAKVAELTAQLAKFQ